MSLKIAINGAAGRMGRRLMALTAADDALELSQAIEYAGHPLMGQTARVIDPEAESDVMLSAELTNDAAALIDFTTPEATIKHAACAAELGIALVIGTTGMTEDQEKIVRDAATKVPVIHAGNYSLGVNLLVRVAGEVARALGDDFNIEIEETHHNQKADAPSGTALMIARSICDALGRDIKKDLVHGRSGRPGPRTKTEIGMHALRLGAVVGEHTAHFASLSERIELTHRAQNRDVFAAGALRAAKWLVGKAPGMYSMDDVLFGKK